MKDGIIRFLICLGSLLVCNQKVLAQLDSVFWFVAPFTTGYCVGSTIDTPFVFTFVSYNNFPTQVTLSQPANTSFNPITKTIPAYSFDTINITSLITNFANNPANTVLNYGVKIETTGLVNVYYSVNYLNPEVFVLKGNNALGKCFMIPGQNNFANTTVCLPQAYQRIDIVATTDSTDVVITPKVAMLGHSAGIPFTIRLDKGQTYCCRANTKNASDHLQGTIVMSTYPIAITVTDDYVEYNYPSDMIGEQIVPMQTVGNEYIPIKGNLNGNNDKVYIIATANNTSVYTQGNSAPIATVNKGDSYAINYPAGNNSMYIKTSKPTYAFQLTGDGYEFDGCQLPFIKNGASNEVRYKRSQSSNYTLTLHILVPSNGDNSFLINGNASVINSSDFSFVPGTNNMWKYASKVINSTIAPFDSVFKVENTVKFHLAVFEVNSVWGSTTYNYISNYQDLNHSSIDSQAFCIGDSARLFVIDTVGFSNIRWQKPDGSIHAGHELIINPINISDTGKYIVYADSPLGCEIKADTINVKVLLKDSIKILQFSPLCFKDSVVLHVTSTSNSFLWNTGNTTASIVVNQSGYFSVESKTGCSNKDSIYVFQVSVSISQENSFCEVDTVKLHAISNVSQYLWSTGDTTQTISIDSAGIYWVQADTGSCAARDTIEVKVL